ncbi:MAG TPA: Omp28-related outer membrane protein [Flavobacteriaceae bacterium]|nr:Omp28-related outer membrane protein [Flavobacteriaceae bacterium]
MNISRFIPAVLLLFLLISCTENDEPVKLTALDLEYDVSSTEIPVHQLVEFSLKGNDYLDYTDEMMLKVNGEPTEGSSYVFDQDGEFEVQAFVDDLSSNKIVFTVSEGMIISHSSLLKNQVNTFSLYDVSTGDEISGEAIFYVNGEAISGNTFSSDVVGEYEVYAEYTAENGEAITTDPANFTVVVPVQRALIEDYTGTWCGYCPRLQSVIKEVLDMTDLVSAIAIHKSSSDSNPDPYEYEFVEDLVEVYNPFGEFPLGQINRTNTWTDNNPNTVLDYVGDNSQIAIAAKTRFDGSDLNIDVRVASTVTLTDKRIVVAALENLLYHDQTSYLNNDPSSPWYQQGNPIPDYENNHVLRHAMTNIFGDPIPATDALTDYKKSYSMNMEEYFEVPEDGEVVIFVLDQEGTVEQVVGLGLNDNLEYK